MAGFLLFRNRTLHRTAFDYSAKGLTLRASAKALFNTAPAPVVRVRSPYLEEPAYGGFFAFWGTDSPSNCVRLFGLKTSPCGPALKRCSTRRQRRLSESGRPIQKNPPMAGFCFSETGLVIELRSIIQPKASPYGLALKRCSTRRQRRLSESGRPIQKNPPMAGFLLFRDWTLHRTAFDYSAKGLPLRASGIGRMLPSLLGIPPETLAPRVSELPHSRC